MHLASSNTSSLHGTAFEDLYQYLYEDIHAVGNCGGICSLPVPVFLWRHPHAGSHMACCSLWNVVITRKRLHGLCPPIFNVSYGVSELAGRWSPHHAILNLYPIVSLVQECRSAYEQKGIVYGYSMTDYLSKNMVRIVSMLRNT